MMQFSLVHGSLLFIVLFIEHGTDHSMIFGFHVFPTHLGQLRSNVFFTSLGLSWGVRDWVSFNTKIPPLSRLLTSDFGTQSV